MPFKTSLASDFSQTFFDTDEFGVSITTSAGSTIAGLIDYAQDLGDYAAGGQARYATIYVRVADIADPQRYQTLVVGGVTWRIESVISSDADVHTLLVTQDRRVS